jgi:hypothetical protein
MSNNILVCHVAGVCEPSRGGEIRVGTYAFDYDGKNTTETFYKREVFAADLQNDGNRAAYYAVGMTLKWIAAHVTDYDAFYIWSHQPIAIMQLEGEWQVNSRTLRELYARCVQLQKTVKGVVQYGECLREQNEIAISLCSRIVSPIDGITNYETR